MVGSVLNGTSALLLYRGMFTVPLLERAVDLTSHRMIMGMRGAYLTQAMRIMLSIVWYGSQAWLGGLCVSAMLSSWSYNFLMMENTLPASANMVTRDLVGFTLFHVISVPFLVSLDLFYTLHTVSNKPL